VRDGQIWGVVGEFAQSVRRAFKLPEFAAGFELHIELVSKQTSVYKPLSRYPSVTQDISLKVAPEMNFSDVTNAAESALASLRSDELELGLSPLGVYTPEQGDSKTITFRLKATNYSHTLTDSVVSEYIDRIVQSAASACGAEKV
jgi:phenylalanyl-tRNA synthetase beta chain